MFGSFDFKFDKLYARRSFYHWFIYNGMEEDELREARENIATLERDYTTMYREEAFGEEE